jgi:uncharacterized protein (DUF2141 family)
VKQLLIAIVLFSSASTLCAVAGDGVPVSAMPDSSTAPSPEGKCTLRIHATGFRSQKGMADAVIFASPDGWPEQKDKSVADDAVPISGSEATFTFKLPPGKYAVAVLDDANENQKLDRNLLGVPTEGFGFANNPPVFLTAPSFAQAAVPLLCPVTRVPVKIIYK